MTVRFRLSLFKEQHSSVGTPVPSQAVPALLFPHCSQPLPAGPTGAPRARPCPGYRLPRSCHSPSGAGDSWRVLAPTGAACFIGTQHAGTPMLSGVGSMPPILGPPASAELRCLWATCQHGLPGEWSQGAVRAAGQAGTLGLQPRPEWAHVDQPWSPTWRGGPLTPGGTHMERGMVVVGTEQRHGSGLHTWVQE